MLHQLDALIEQAQSVHRAFGVVAMRAYVFRPCAFGSLPFFSRDAFELRIGESEKLLGRCAGKKYRPVFLDDMPEFCRDFLGFSKQEVQCRGISLCSHSSPFAQRIESYVEVVRPISALIPSSGPDKMLLRIKAQYILWLFDVNAIDVGIVGLSYFCPMQLRSADEKLNETARLRKSGLLDHA